MSCNHDHFRQLFRSPQAYPWNFFPLPSVGKGSVSCTALQCLYDYEGVPRGIWIVSWEAGWVPLHYVNFKSGLTERNFPRELGRSVGKETLCPCKVRLSCSGLEWCASTDTAQHSLQRAKPQGPKGVLGCRTLSPRGSVGLQKP